MPRKHRWLQPKALHLYRPPIIGGLLFCESICAFSFQNAGATQHDFILPHDINASINACPKHQVVTISAAIEAALERHGGMAQRLGNLEFRIAHPLMIM